jgi:predicted transcriptional regulator of viral defense system
MRVAAHGDRAVARLAAAQHGVVTATQLVRTGLSRGAIAHRVAQGRLHRVHHGVYLVGHPIPPALARETAALLACGDGAVLSHRSAGKLWALLDADGSVDVTVLKEGKGRAGIRIHRTACLETRDIKRRHGLPLTSPARTLLDLAEVLTPRELERPWPRPSEPGWFAPPS